MSLHSATSQKKKRTGGVNNSFEMRPLHLNKSHKSTHQKLLPTLKKICIMFICFFFFVKYANSRVVVLLSRLSRISFSILYESMFELLFHIYWNFTCLLVSYFLDQLYNSKSWLVVMFM